MQLQGSDKLILPVNVFGTDAEGKPFYQFTTAQAVSVRGAVLDALDCQLRPGEIIGVQYRDRKTRALVLWSCELESGPKMQVGVQLMPAAGCPWEAQLDEARQETKSSPVERRSYSRHRVAIGVEVQHRPTGMRMQGQTADISGSGCYIETILPLPADTVVQLAMYIDSEKWELSGVVRTSHPGVGMGIEFTDLTGEQQACLDQYLCARAIPASTLPPS